MPADDALKKAIRLVQLRQMLLSQPDRTWRTREVAERLGVSEDSARRDLEDLSGAGLVPLYTEGAGPSSVWLISPASRAVLPPLHLDYAQGAALYTAARLLSQQQDERNDVVRAALSNLISILPESLRPHLERLVVGLGQSEGRGNVTTIFETLARAWLTRKVVTMIYEPPHKNPYTCRFAPYLLEPSGFGRTIYFIGHSTPPGELRTYKLERVRQAALTGEAFEIPPSFSGSDLLKQAWGVMYGGDEPAHVKLQFTLFVSQRVRETIWHPSQKLTETPTGLLWEADIADVTEMKPWIRGWGGDCEVIEPAALRQEMIQEVHRLARAYGINPTTVTPEGKPDESLLTDLFGEE